MYLDGVPRPGADLAISISATHTDLNGYSPVYLYQQDEAPAQMGKWAPYFIAVRKDVLEMAGFGLPGQTKETLMNRLNEVLLGL